MDFSEALKTLKAGNRVSRAGWNGRGMWVTLVGRYEWGFVVDKVMNPTKAEPLPWIMMRTANNEMVPWLASQTDILAEDWRME